MTSLLLDLWDDLKFLGHFGKRLLDDLKLLGCWGLEGLGLLGA